MNRATAPLALACAALPAAAQDAARGGQLYETHCGSCHYERVHERVRERSLVRSLAELRVEVVRRAQQTRRTFTVEDLDDIAEYPTAATTSSRSEPRRSQYGRIHGRPSTIQ